MHRLRDAPCSLPWEDRTSPVVLGTEGAKQKYVNMNKEGTEPVMWTPRVDMPDCALPAPPNITVQLLDSMKFTRKTLEVRVSVCFCAESST